MTRFLTAILLLVVGILLIVFFIANRQPIPLSMDPFSLDDPALATPPIPVAVHLAIALLVGFGLGAFGMYLSGAKKRRRLRERSREVRRLREELREARAVGLPALRDRDRDGDGDVEVASQPAPSDAARLPAPTA